jgi:hypothetical protein
VMNRLKALYRSWAIPCAGERVYAPRHRNEWLAKITEAGVRRRAEFYYQQLDALQALRQQVRRDLLVESKKHNATNLLRQIPSIGPIRAALLVALILTEPARASPVRKEIADKVDSRITNGLRMIFRTRTSQPCFRSCATSFGPAVRARSSASACVKPARDVRKSRSSCSPSFLAASRTAGETRIFCFFDFVGLEGSVG